MGRKLEGAERDVVVASTADLDPIANLAKARGNFLLQFATDDEYVPRDRAEEFFKVAPDTKKLLWYDAGHGLNGQARSDRLNWLSKELGLK